MISGERRRRRKEEFGENFYLIKINLKSTKVSHIIVMKVCTKYSTIIIRRDIL